LDYNANLQLKEQLEKTESIFFINPPLPNIPQNAPQQGKFHISEVKSR